MVYSHKPETWSRRQSVETLQQLAEVAHRLDCTRIMALCDEALVLKSGAAEHPDLQLKPSSNTCLTAASVAKLYTVAGDLHLAGRPRAL